MNPMYDNCVTDDAGLACASRPAVLQKTIRHESFADGTEVQGLTVLVFLIDEEVSLHHRQGTELGERGGADITIMMSLIEEKNQKTQILSV